MHLWTKPKLMNERWMSERMKRKVICNHSLRFTARNHIKTTHIFFISLHFALFFSLNLIFGDWQWFRVCAYIVCFRVRCSFNYYNSSVCLLFFSLTHVRQQYLHFIKLESVYRHKSVLLANFWYIWVRAHTRYVCVVGDNYRYQRYLIMALFKLCISSF